MVSMAVDAQMGIEKALSSLATGLAGANMVYESSGMMASLPGVSHAAFVVDGYLDRATDNQIRSHFNILLDMPGLSDKIYKIIA